MGMVDAILLLSAFINIALPIPQPVQPPANHLPAPSGPSQPPQLQGTQQSLRPFQDDPFSELLIPDCALSCYLQALPEDGCVQELDLKCHCTAGDLLGKSDACVKAACGVDDQASAKMKFVKACQAVGVTPTLPGSPTTIAATSASATLTTAISTTAMPVESLATSLVGSELSSASEHEPPGLFSSSFETQMATNVSVVHVPKTSTLTLVSTPSSTDRPSTAPASAGGLSDGAKAGISLSIIFVASSIFIALSFHIRHLKRRLALATAAADVPESALRPPSRRQGGGPEVLFIPGHRRSWPATYQSRKFSQGEYTRTGGSLLSPSMNRGGGRRASVAGMLNSKRISTLSVVFEHEDEDESSLVSRGRAIREPVPGQAEGLAGPVEMDGQFSAIYEAPTSITPRARSREHVREVEE